MDTDKIKVFGSRVRVDSVAKVAQIEVAEKEKMKEKVNAILKHDINCFINRQLIYNYPEQLFADAGVTAIEHADFEGIERLALVLGGEIVSTFWNPEKVKLGQCDLISEVMIGEDRMIKFSGCKGNEACTVILRGATQQILDESEMLMATAVRKLAESTPGKESLAMESFAHALTMLPTIIADNAGYDSADLVSQLRAEHSDASGKCHMGLDMELGEVGDMRQLGITKSFSVKRQMLLSAAEAAEMILRVDDIIKCAPRPRRNDECM